MTAALTSLCSPSTLSISPNSIRCPLTFTCSSRLPKYSISPSPLHLTSSPVRYSRSPSPYLLGTNFIAVSAALPRYPRANPSPPMYSSPLTPIGTSSPSPLLTYNCVLPIPPPSLTCPSPLCRLTLDQIVVSVGPYIFHNSPTRPVSSAASSWLNASPPTNPFICRLPCQPLSISSRQPAGVACITVASLSSSSCFNASPSLVAWRLTTNSR